jgi:hypothetical protein
VAIQLVDAERRKAKLRLGLDGPSGSGKTISALLIAYGLCGNWSKIALIDTEKGSGQLPVGQTISGTKIGVYKYAGLRPPFMPAQYIEAIHAAEQAGCEVVILDSISHAWAGEGGLLEYKDQVGARIKNDFAAWREVTPLHNKFVEAMLQSSIHVIATLRTKTEWVLVDDDRGKKVPKKLGLAPVFKDGIEYEFTIYLDIDQEKHIAYGAKDRSGLVDGKYFVPTVDTGKLLREWLETGTDPLPEQPPYEPPHQPAFTRTDTKPAEGQPRPIEVQSATSSGAGKATAKDWTYFWGTVKTIDPKADAAAIRKQLPDDATRADLDAYVRKLQGGQGQLPFAAGGEPQ